MTTTTPRSSPLNRSSPCASAKRSSLQRLVVMVLLSSSPASCVSSYATRDVRPLITSLSSITYKTGVIGYISPGMIDARATDCQPP